MKELRPLFGCSHLLTRGICFSQFVVELPKKLDFGCGLEAQLQCATLGRCGLLKNLTFWEIRPPLVISSLGNLKALWQ